MKIRKLREGKRKIGSTVIQQEDLIDLREVSSQAAQGKWDDGTIESGDVMAELSDTTNVYCEVEVADYGELDIPDRTFLFKLLQIV